MSESMVLSVPASGRLSRTSLPTLLRSLQRNQATGILTVTRNDQTRLIYFEKGDMIFASSRYEDDRLGEMLLKWGNITYVQYETSVEILKRTGKRQGAILVEEGYITPKELFHAVTAQVKEIILSLFTWLEGDYTFEERPLPTDEVIKLRMSTGSMIYEGIRRISDLSRLRRTLPPFETIVAMSTDPRDLFQPVEVTQTERVFLLLVDGVKTIRELVREAKMPALRTLQMLHFLLAAGIIQTRNAAASVSEAPEDSRQRIELELESIISEAISRKRVEELDASRVELFEEDSAEEQAVGPEAIKQAYDTLEGKNYYDILGVDQQASTVELKKAYFRLAKAYHPDRHHQPGMEPHHHRLEVLFDRLTKAYDTLINDQTKRQYDEEQSLLHRPPPDVAREAAPVEREQQAVKQCKQGEAALMAGKAREALACLEWAVQLDDTKARYRALLGQALANVTGRQRDAERELKAAIQMDPSNGDYYVVLGLLYLKLKDKENAILQFEEALRRDPANTKARDQLTWLKS